MDGLLGNDTSAINLLSLLGGDPEEARRQARAQALLQMAQGFYQAATPSDRPTNIGSAITGSVLAGQKAYQTALQDAMQGQLQQQKIKDLIREQQGAQLLGKSFVTPEQETPALQPTPQQIEQGIVPQPTITRGTPQFDVSKYIQGAIQLGINPKTIMENVKSMQGEQVKLGEGEKLYRQNPVTGALESIASGGAKADSNIREAMTILGISTPIEQLSPLERQRIGAYIDRKEMIKSPKVQVDLKDPTAVTKAQMDVTEKYLNNIKSSGDIEVANRFSALQSGYAQAKQGNPSAHAVILYSVAKILDPTGAVRDGDVATILGNPNLPEKVRLAAQQFVTGGIMTPNQIDQLYAAATDMVQKRNEQLQPLVNTYKKFSSQLGGTGEDIRNPYENTQPVVKPGGLDMNALLAEKRRRGM